MDVGKNIKNPWVYVDDSDPAIIYSEGWLAESGLQTDLDALSEPESINTPTYGTLHSTPDNGILLTPFNFWYIFNGTDFMVMFRGSITALLDHANCTIDGIQQHFEIFKGRTTCFNGKALSPTSHNLSVSFPSHKEIIIGGDTDSMSLDWLAFNPLKAPRGDADILHLLSHTDMTPLKFSFEFNGISAGVYAIIGPDGHAASEEDTTACSLFSYTVDSGPPVNVTIETHTKIADTRISPQLILQTPPLVRKLHMLNLTCLESGNRSSAPFFTGVVQNTTRFIDLTPVPNITRSAVTAPQLTYIASVPSLTPTTSDTPISVTHGPSQHINRGIIVAIAISTSAILLIVVWFWRRLVVQRRALAASDGESMVEPFIAPVSQGQAGRFRLAQYTTREKTNKYRQAFGIPVPDRGTLAQGPEDATASVERYGHVDQSRRVRYRVHEDGGHIVVNDDVDDEDIISLPPIYDTVRRSRVQSGLTVSAPLYLAV